MSLDPYFDSCKSGQMPTQADSMKYEALRLATFSKKPRSKGYAYSVSILANAGFFYNPVYDGVQCFSCSMRVGYLTNLDYDANLFYLYLKHHASCDFVNNRSENVPYLCPNSNKTKLKLFKEYCFDNTLGDTSQPRRATTEQVQEQKYNECLAYRGYQFNQYDNEEQKGKRKKSNTGKHIANSRDIKNNTSDLSIRPPMPPNNPVSAEFPQINSNSPPLPLPDFPGSTRAKSNISNQFHLSDRGQEKMRKRPSHRQCLIEMDSAEDTSTDCPVSCDHPSVDILGFHDGAHQKPTPGLDLRSNSHDSNVTRLHKCNNCHGLFGNLDSKYESKPLPVCLWFHDPLIFGNSSASQLPRTNQGNGIPGSQTIHRLGITAQPQIFVREEEERRSDSLRRHDDHRRYEQTGEGPEEQATVDGRDTESHTCEQITHSDDKRKHVMCFSDVMVPLHYLPQIQD